MLSSARRVSLGAKGRATFLYSSCNGVGIIVVAVVVVVVVVVGGGGGGGEQGVRQSKLRVGLYWQEMVWLET